MSTPAQSIFPKKPKLFSTPLKPLAAPEVVKTPLAPKHEVEEPRPRGRPRKETIDGV